MRESKVLKFEFDFDEVFEGIERGVVDRISDYEFESMLLGCKNELHAEFKAKFEKDLNFSYADVNELREKVKSDIVENLSSKIHAEVHDATRKRIEEILLDFNTKYIPDEMVRKIVNEAKLELSDRLYRDISSMAQKCFEKESKKIVSQMTSSLNLRTKANVEPFVTQEELSRLRARDEKLSALETHGVDNWEGYDISMEDLVEEE